MRNNDSSDELLNSRPANLDQVDNYFNNFRLINDQLSATNKDKDDNNWFKPERSFGSSLNTKNDEYSENGGKAADNISEILSII